MKRIVLLSGFIAAISICPSAAAEQKPKFITTWDFRVEYVDTHQVMQDSDPTQEGEVPLPSGSLLYCTRFKSQVRKDGSVWSGFGCFSHGELYATVSVTAICRTSQPSWDVGKAMLETRVDLKDRKGPAVVLSVFCATKQVNTGVPPINTQL